MTFDTSQPEDGEADHILALMKRHVRRALDDLDATIDELDAQKSEVPARIEKAAQAARKAIQTLFDERKTLATLSQQTGGAAAHGALDLDAARDEIGRRLVSLRAARDADGVSE